MNASSKKVIFLVGANSKFIQEFVHRFKLNNSYDAIYYVSHRKYMHKVNDKKEFTLKFTSTDNFLDQLDNILKNNVDFADFIFSNTPTRINNFTENTKEWAELPSLFIDKIAYFNNINRCVFLGSTLSIVPIIKNTQYKIIKRNEFNKYLVYKNLLQDKVAYLMLPPIDDKIKGIGYLFKESKSLWLDIAYKSLSSKESLVIPTGLNGILVKILLLFKKL